MLTIQSISNRINTNSDQIPNFLAMNTKYLIFYKNFNIK